MGGPTEGQDKGHATGTPRSRINSKDTHKDTHISDRVLQPVVSERVCVVRLHGRVMICRLWPGFHTSECLCEEL